MAKGVEDHAVEEAKIILGFTSGQKVTYSDLRRSYKHLARQFHPDKNPNGRPMFEKIRIAYDLLSSVELQVTETDLSNVALLLKTQNIIYRRFPHAVNDQKYPAFQFLLAVLAVPTIRLYSSEKEQLDSAQTSSRSDVRSGVSQKGGNTDTEIAQNKVDDIKEVRKEMKKEMPAIGSFDMDTDSDYIRSDLLLEGTILIFYTCSVSPLNVREFVAVGGTQKLFDIVVYAIHTLDTIMNNQNINNDDNQNGFNSSSNNNYHSNNNYNNNNNNNNNNENNTIKKQKIAEGLLFYSMKAFTSIAAFDVGRNSIKKLCPKFADEMNKLLIYDKLIPVAIESCIETISRCCADDNLQNYFINSGIVWKLIPFLLSYDNTISNTTYENESSRIIYNQNSSNVHAILSAKCLGRLCGVMFDDLSSPFNKSLSNTMNILLTQPIAKLLRNRKPWDMLSALNENVERTTMIWNLNMRKELLDFVLAVQRDRPVGSRENEMKITNRFKFSALNGELCVCGVYLRIFNRTARTVDIDDPSLLAKDLLDYVRNVLLTTGDIDEGREQQDDEEEEGNWREANSCGDEDRNHTSTQSYVYTENPLINSKKSNDKKIGKSKDIKDDEESKGMSDGTSGRELRERGRGRSNSDSTDDRDFYDTQDGSMVPTSSSSMPSTAYKRGSHFGLQLSVEALRTLCDIHDYISYDIATHIHGPDTVFLLLDLPDDSMSFMSAAQLLTSLGRSPDFVSIAMKSTNLIPYGQLTGTGDAAGTGPGSGSGLELKPDGVIIESVGTREGENIVKDDSLKDDIQHHNKKGKEKEKEKEKEINRQNYHPSCLWRLLRSICTSNSASSSLLWTAAESYTSHTEGLRAILDTGGVAHMLGVLTGVSGYTNNFHNRLSAMSLLTKFLNSPVMGAESSLSLRRFLPEPLVLLLRSRSATSALTCLDEICETPEMIWTAEMQQELRIAVTNILNNNSKENEKNESNRSGKERGGRENDYLFYSVPYISENYSVTYRQINDEIYVGGVYIRLYMKQPMFRLSNSMFFLERLVELWEHSFSKQVPSASSIGEKTCFYFFHL